MENLIQLPFSREAEMAVIASIIEDCELMSRIEFLNADDFYLRPHVCCLRCSLQK